MPTLETGLLDNQDVVAYLEAFGRYASNFPTNRTATPEFQAGIVALDDGLVDEDATAPRAPTLFPRTRTNRSMPLPTTRPATPRTLDPSGPRRSCWE